MLPRFAVMYGISLDAIVAMGQQVNASITSVSRLVLFAVVPLSAAVSLCDLFYALMAFPTMFAVLRLSGRVRQATRDYFAKSKTK